MNSGLRCHIASSPVSTAHADEDEQTVITNIRANAVTLGPGRFPAYFYTAVHHSSCQWRTENKRFMSVNSDVVEWDDPISIPSDPSAAVRLSVYASFEYQRILGRGELLQQITSTVGQLLDHSINNIPFTFLKDEEDVSTCTSLSVHLRQCKCRSGGTMSPIILDSCSTTRHQNELEDVIDKGHGALSRYRRTRSERDLKSSIGRFEYALNICPEGDPYRAAALSNLAMAKFLLCQIDDTGVSLDVPLCLYCDALLTRPTGHPDRLSTLIRLAGVHVSRFENRGEEVDAVQAEAFLHEAMALSSKDSHEKQAAISVLQLFAGRKGDLVSQLPVPKVTDMDRWILSVHLLQRYERVGDLDALQQAIALLVVFVESTSVEDPQYLDALGNYGVALLYRFCRCGDLSDLERGISMFTGVVHQTPHDHPDRLSRLNNLARSFLIRFNRLGEFGDLQQAISKQGEVVDSVSHDNPSKPRYLSNLGISFLTRFEHLGELCDLEQAISRLSEAVSLTLDDHPGKPGFLINLGNSYLARFEYLEELSDLEQAISHHTNSVNPTSNKDPQKPGYLSNLGKSYLRRFGSCKDIKDLEQAISMFENAADLTPDDHLDKPRRLDILGKSLRVCFEHLGGFDDLERAISIHEGAVNLVSDDHPDKPSYLNNLGNSFRTRFEYIMKFSDLERAISSFQNAVDLTPDDHPHVSHYLNNLGDTLLSRFDCLGELGDVEQAILMFSKATELTPPGYPEKPDHLSNLSISLLTRFEQIGEPGDVEKAILKQENAIDLVPDDHPKKSSFLNNLGTCFSARFERLLDLGDLERAISAFRNAIDLNLDTNPKYHGHLNNLGNALLSRFECIGELRDLEQAILVLENAVDLTPNGHPRKPRRLNNLSNTYLTRFEHLGELSDLEQAVSKFKDAISLVLDGHPDKSACLNNLGISLLTRFGRLGKRGDLDEAIFRLQNAIDLTPNCQPRVPGYFNSLGNAFFSRFEHFGEASDLEQAISIQRTAVDLTPLDHPHKTTYLNNLAGSFNARFGLLQKPSDLEHVISLYAHSACASTGYTTSRFYASLKWIACARASGHRTLLHAYSTAVGLLPQLTWIGLSLSHRYRDLVYGADLVRDAAAAALDAGLPETAVEWLEQGRSIVWGELFQLRSSYDELSAVHPDYANRLRKLSTALEHAASIRERTTSSLSMPARGVNHDTTELEKEADKHRSLAIERDKLLQEIRGLPGFDRFLLHKEFSQLRTSAHSGPVVILNAAERRCDALIVLADVENVIHVPLSTFTLDRSVGLQDMLKSFVRYRNARVVSCDEREGKPLPEELDYQWELILSALWKSVVKPVLDTLAISIPGGNLTRIFWCPTGPFTFFPFHAAGFYDTQYSQPGNKSFDFVVSSFVPTLSILVPSSHLNDAPDDSLRFLAVRQPQSDGLSPLPGVDAELKHIRTIVQSSPSAATALKFSESSVGSVEEVLELMKEADWVHFACHGIQDAQNAASSGLCLADQRRLTIPDMMALSRPRGGFAFLSACQTATGDRILADEAIHIAAGMLYVGYGGVIGTMWSISDRLAPRVAKNVYDRLFADGTRPDYREAARALQDAIGRLQDDGAPFVEWIPFIHVGL